MLFELFHKQIDYQSLSWMSNLRTVPLGSFLIKLNISLISDVRMYNECMLLLASLVLWCNSTFLQTRWSLVSRLSRLTQVVGTWEPGGEKMERQRRNVVSSRKGRGEE